MDGSPCLTPHRGPRSGAATMLALAIVCALGLCAAGIFALGIFPSGLWQLAQRAAETLPLGAP